MGGSFVKTKGRCVEIDITELLIGCFTKEIGNKDVNLRDGGSPIRRIYV